MARINHELLPVGKEINHNGATLEIVKRVNAGYTGEVYEGNLFLDDKKNPVHVAVKAMKALEFPSARPLFLKEGERLALLMHWEEEANHEQGLVGLRIAPIYYGSSEYQDIPYFVMEFIEGKEIPDLLKDAEDGKFSEQQALTAAWHLYRTLDILHRFLKITFIDLKFGNLWWQDKLGQLKLIDFGTVEEIEEGDTQRKGVLRDILLAGVYFCKMATGNMPNYALGELTEFGELKESVQNAEISWGTQRELKRLLHRNPEQRPMDAKDIANRLRTLVGFWSGDEKKILEIARKSLDLAQSAYDEANVVNQPMSDDGLNVAYRALSAFDIVKRRFPDTDVNLEKEKLDKILKSANYLENGRNLMLASSYTRAKKVFLEGMEAGENSAVLRRWAYLAEIGEALQDDFKAAQDKSFTMLDNTFAKEDWSEALKQLKKIESILAQKKTPVGLSYLFSEARLFSEIAEASKSSESEDFQKAADHYQIANQHLENLPDFYQKFIREIEVGDLEKRAEQMSARVVSQQEKTGVDQDYDAAIELIKNKKENKEQVLALAKKAYLVACKIKHNVERLSKIVYAALEKRDYKLAFDIAQIALLRAPMPQILKENLNVAKHLNSAYQSLDIPDPDQFSEALLGIWNYSDDELTRGCIEDMLKTAENKAVVTENIDLYIVLGELYEKLGNTDQASSSKAKAAKSSEKKDRDENKRRENLEALLREANAVLEMGTFEEFQREKGLDYSLADTIRLLRSKKDGYQYAQRILSRAKILARMYGYDLDNITTQQGEIAQELTRMSASVSDVEKENQVQYENNLKALNIWWSKIESLRDWRERSLEAFGDSKVSQPIYDQMYAGASDFLTACYAILQGETKRTDAKLTEITNEVTLGREDVSVGELLPIEVLIENAHKVLNSLGTAALRATIKNAENAIKQTESLVQEADQAFKDGDLPRAQVLLDRSKPSIGTTPAWRDLYAKAMLVLLWKKWQDDYLEKLLGQAYDADLLKMIRKYAEQKLPMPYWGGSVAEAYLKRMDNALEEKVLDKAENYKVAEFISTLKNWMDVLWTHRLAASSESRYESWSATAWLNIVYDSVYKKNETKFTALTRNTSIPADIDSALAKINDHNWREIVGSAEQARKKRNMVIWIVSGIELIACVALGVIGFLNYESIDQQYTGKYTPTVTSTPTVTPTFTPTLTFTPTATLTLTPIPPSIYKIPDLNTIYPALPASPEFALVIKPEQAKVSPDISDAATWTKETSTDKSMQGDLYYSTLKAVSPSWSTDALPAGWYSIYVLDTKSKSGGFPAIPFNISSNGLPLTPFRGQPSAIFNSEAQGQKADEWLPLGVYEVIDGQNIEIAASIPVSSGNTVFALSKVLILKITDPQKSLYDALPAERVLFSLSDDTSAVVLDTEKKQPLVDPKYQGQLSLDPNILSWGGNFRSLSVDLLNGSSTKVSVQWHSAGRLPAGKYQLLAWIPASGATATGEFSMLLNGKPVDKQVLPIINQADHSAEWWVVDLWNIAEEGSVGIWFTVDVAANAGKSIGIDALALIRVE